MSDPFESLTAGPDRQEPDPEFERRLRSRLQQAFDLPRGVSVSNLTVDTNPTDSRVRAVRHGDPGYVSLWVPDRDRAVRFYRHVLGIEVDADGMVQGVAIAHGIRGGHDEPTFFVCYAVADIEAAVVAVRAAGGTAGEPSVEPWGRTAECTDPNGRELALYQPLPGALRPPAPEPAEGSRPGDLAYISMHAVGDSEPVRRFYSEVLGWQWEAGRVPDGWQARGPVPGAGLGGGRERPVNLPMFRVDDVAAAVARVRELGGTATDPEVMPYGTTSECQDDQGTRFYLGQMSY